MKNKTQIIISIGLIIFGCLLLTFGAVTVPIGIIDSSILIAFGEIATFAGSIIGIDYNYKYKISKSDN